MVTCFMVMIVYEMTMSGVTAYARSRCGLDCSAGDIATSRYSERSVLSGDMTHRRVSARAGSA